ncbi:amidase [Kosakonia sp. MUSA4]|uniref:amidase n=1 Tax=Kosakonia sp. MUSA4 TaxID=2067958 RepID=UPI0015989A8F|nr:amidase [Kosakonia sp. MUSA4]QJT82551.1 hypothetical protein C0557_21970 [Kosakonia sp. MUSA4]
MNEVIDFSLARISFHLQRGDLSPVDLMRLYLTRIDCLNPSLNCYVEIFRSEALKQALLAEKDILSGRCLGPLHGIPFSFKDFFDYSGMVTGGGTRCFHEKKTITAPVIQSLKNLGMIPIGKNSAVELGMGASGVSESGLTAVNPWLSHRHYAPGGSSSGSAVAVASTLTPLSLATDTGGSIRIPAGWCGVSGLRPSSRRLSVKGVLPLSQTMDTVGLIGKTAADIGMVYRQLVSHACDFPERLSFKLASLPDEDMPSIDTEYAVIFQKTLEKIKSDTLDIKTISFFTSLNECMRVNSTITSFEAWRNYSHLCKDGSGLGPNIIKKLSRGKNINEEEYKSAIKYCMFLRDRVFSWFSQIDALVIPTTPSSAWLIAEDSKYSPPNDFTRFVNFLDLCAISIPMGINSNGMPLSFQIVCRHGDDLKALHIAEVIEDRIRFRMRFDPFN